MSDNGRNSLFTKLYRAYYKDVCDYCLTKIRYNDQLAPYVEDCVQDAFVKLMEKIDILSPEVNLSGWLCKTAWYKLLTRIHSAGVQKRIILEHITELYTDPLSVDNEIDEWVKTDAFLEKIDKIYQSSSEIEEKVFNSYFVQNSSIMETATDNNLSKNSVRSAVERIRRRLQNKSNNAP